MHTLIYIGSFIVIKLILLVCLFPCKPKYIQNAVVLFSVHAFSMLQNLRNAFNALLIYLSNSHLCMLRLHFIHNLNLFSIITFWNDRMFWSSTHPKTVIIAKLKIDYSSFTKKHLVNRQDFPINHIFNTYMTMVKYIFFAFVKIYHEIFNPNKSS